jgi:DNA-binding LytR/AlgR family response regulator
MNILIVENEKPAVERLSRIVRNAEPDARIIGVTETVEDTINRLQSGPLPDLILMDIQLDDGICFEIFDTIQVDIPVIFTTAYDEYMLKAFKVNSIDYLLKPVDEDLLKAALQKHKKLFGDRDPLKRDFRELLNEFRHQHKSRFLIKIGEKYKSVATREVSCFAIDEKSVFIHDIQGKIYGIDYSLEQLQGVVDPRKFFRINRDCIVNIDAIDQIHSWSSSRLKLALKNSRENDRFIVSREKVSEFKRWIDR